MALGTGPKFGPKLDLEKSLMMDIYCSYTKFDPARMLPW